jgi:hypothetical protein
MVELIRWMVVELVEVAGILGLAVPFWSSDLSVRDFPGIQKSVK